MQRDCQRADAYDEADVVEREAADAAVDRTADRNDLGNRCQHHECQQRLQQHALC